MLPVQPQRVERALQTRDMAVVVRAPDVYDQMCIRDSIEYDEWFFESSLHNSGYVADTVSELTKRGFTYEKDGALWLATSRILGDGLRAAGKSEKDIEKLDLKDDVLRRARCV